MLFIFTDQFAFVHCDSARLPDGLICCVCRSFAKSQCCVSLLSIERRYTKSKKVFGMRFVLYILFTCFPAARCEDEILTTFLVDDV